MQVFKFLTTMQIFTMFNTVMKQKAVNLPGFRRLLNDTL